MKNLFYAIKNKETGKIVEIPTRLYLTAKQAQAIIDISNGEYEVVKIELKEIN